MVTVDNRNLSMPCPTVPLPTFYGHLFSQNKDPDPEQFAWRITAKLCQRKNYY